MKEELFYLTGSFLLSEGSGLPSYALERRVFNVDAPSHPAVSVPSILPPFTSYMTLNSLSQPPLEKLHPSPKEEEILLLSVLEQTASVALPCLFCIHCSLTYLLYI